MVASSLKSVLGFSRFWELICLRLVLQKVIWLIPMEMFYKVFYFVSISCEVEVISLKLYISGAHDVLFIQMQDDRSMLGLR